MRGDPHSRGRTPPPRPQAAPRGVGGRAPPRSPRSSGARRCRAGGAASRSRASRQARARRRPAAPRSRSSAPENRAAAEAQAAGADVLETGLAEGVQQPRHRPALVELPDAAAQEPPDLVPPRRDDTAERGQADIDVEVPEGARGGARRDAEVEERRASPLAAARARGRAGRQAGRSSSAAGRRR